MHKRTVSDENINKIRQNTIVHRSDQTNDYKKVHHINSNHLSNLSIERFKKLIIFKPLIYRGVLSKNKVGM